MKIIIKNINNQNINNISLKKLDFFSDFFETYYSLNEQVKISIYALNEKINSHELKNFKIYTAKFNIESLKIFSNIRETIISAKSLKINSTYVKEKDLKLKIFLSSSNKHFDTLHKGTIRSGNRISSNGDLIIIGDVNPGAIVSPEKYICMGKIIGYCFSRRRREQKCNYYFTLFKTTSIKNR